jgi:PAS domain S-box-containing protein
VNNRRRDGSSFINELHVAPVHDAAGRLVQFIGVLNDVTERVRDAERLRISEDLYRSVAATISDGLLVVGPAGNIIAANLSACEIIDAGADRLVGHRLSELGYRLNTEDDRPMSAAEHPVYRVLRGEPSVRDQPHLLHRPDGSTRLVQMSVRPLRASAGGTPISCLVTFRDITDRRAAEDALAAAEERWKFALEGAGDGVWDYDERTRRTFFSPRWKEMLGYTESEIGTSLKEWSGRVHPDDKERVDSEIRRYRAGAIPAYRTEHRLRHKDGHWVWVLDRGKIVERHPDGSPRRVVGTHTDITRLKLAEQALRDKQAAELASRAKSEFLSRMSHEMRTPLNAVIGFTQLLRMQTDGGPAKVAEYTDHVLRASEHLLALVNEVLDLQRVEEGRVTLQPEPVQLAPFVETALDLLRPMAQRQNIALASQVGAGVWAHCDPRSLRQVLINVISNAVKYNRAGGWVCVGLLDAPPGRVAIAVEDTGSGLSDEQLLRLFQPFERLGHESSEIEGSGLGLVIARSLAGEMGGELTLSSVPNAGTLARIELPGCDAPDTVPAALVDAPADAAPASAPPPRTSMRLLYVEDNRINALLFEEAMRLLGGFDLRVAEDGADALTLVRDWTPQVLVLDANLPDMSGFEVLRRLRELPALADVPAYMCSADAMPEDIQRARDAGFDGYWTKPIEMAIVSADLESLRPGAGG